MRHSDYGSVLVLDQDKILHVMMEAILQEAFSDKETSIVALSGGSTPKTFYECVAKKEGLDDGLLSKIVWTASDERFVERSSDQSNFGVAERMFLDPLKIEADKRLGWDTTLSPEEAAAHHNKAFEGKEIDVCFLGMGDDCHTASIFPGSDLVESGPESMFAAVEVEGKGSRLTITPYGLSRCKKIIIAVIGKSKAEAVKRALEGDFDPKSAPVQLLKKFHENTVWLVDHEAHSALREASVEL